MDSALTLKSVMTQEGVYLRFTFSCALCDRSHTTQRIYAESISEARAIAAKEARPLFNRCHGCGSWVCDEHYNEDVMQCTACAPRA